jgi:hypothetical protein
MELKHGASTVKDERAPRGASSLGLASSWRNSRGRSVRGGCLHPAWRSMWGEGGIAINEVWLYNALWREV